MGVTEDDKGRAGDVGVCSNGIHMVDMCFFFVTRLSQNSRPYAREFTLESRLLYNRSQSPAAGMFHCAPCWPSSAIFLSPISFSAI